MKKPSISACVAFCFLVFCAMAFAQKQARINFAKGAVSAVVTGRLSGYRDSKSFVIRVRPGQTLRTAQVGDLHDITVYIQGPGGDDTGDSDASCNNRREISPTEAGDYRITVVECRKADAWRGQFRFRISVR